jgi:hypothetical protein
MPMEINSLRSWVDALPADAELVELGVLAWASPPESQGSLSSFFWVLIDLIVELLGLIIKPFDNQTES